MNEKKIVNRIARENIIDRANALIDPDNKKNWEVYMKISDEVTSEYFPDAKYNDGGQGTLWATKMILERMKEYYKNEFSELEWYWIEGYIRGKIGDGMT